MLLNSADTTSLAESLEEVNPSVLLETMKNAVPGLIRLGTRLLIAVVILLIGRKIIKILCKMLKTSFEKFGIESGLSQFLNAVAKAILYTILILIIAEYIGIQSTSILAVFGSASLALGLALQGSLANFAGGVLILVMKPFKVGDYIITTSGEGSVTNIGLVYTMLLTPDNKTVVLPNGSLSNSALTNVTAMDKRRVDVLVSISYDADLKKAKELMEMILKRQKSRMENEDMTVMVDSLASSAVVIGGRIWVPASEYWPTKWNILEEIKMEFDTNGIQIPYPQMDVHVKNSLP